MAPKQQRKRARQPVEPVATQPPAPAQPQGDDPFSRLFPAAASTEPSAESGAGADAFSRLYPEAAASSAPPQQSGVDVGTRFQLGMKATEAGKLNLLRERYGEKNVLVDSNDGSIWIRDPASGKTQPLPVDPSPEGGLTWKGVKSVLSDLPGDIADVGGDVLEAATGGAGTAAGALSGAITGSVVLPGVGAVPGAVVGGLLGTYGGGVAANAMRQEGSAILPGSDELTPVQRVGMASDAGVNAIVGEGAGPLFGAAFDKLRPTNWLRKTINSGADPRMAAKADTITADTGVQFTPGQRHGGRTALRMEGTLAQGEVSGDTMFKGYLKQAQQFQDYAHKLASGSTTAEEGGVAFADATKDTFAALDKAHRRQAAKQFGEVAAISGGEPVIPLQNTIGRAQQILKEYEPLLGPETAKKFAVAIVGDMDKMLEAGRAQLIREAQQRGASPAELKALAEANPLELKGLRGDAMQFQNAMADIRGKVRNKLGVLNVAPDVRAKIAGDMLHAMRADLDAAADMAPVNQQAAAALKTARSSYAEMEAKKKTVQTQLLRDALKLAANDAPDTAIRKLLTNESHVQVSRAMKVLNAYSPDAAVQTRQDALMELFRKAAPTPSMAARDIEIGPVQFYRLARQYKDNIRAMYTGDADGYVKFMRLFKAAERIVDTAGVASSGGGSQTKLLDWFGEARDLTVKAFTDRKAAIEKVATTFNAENLARMMSVGEGDAILKLKEMRPGTKAFINAAAKLGAISKRRDSTLDRDGQPAQKPAQ